MSWTVIKIEWANFELQTWLHPLWNSFTRVRQTEIPQCLSCPPGDFCQLGIHAAGAPIQQTVRNSIRMSLAVVRALTIGKRTAPCAIRNRNKDTNMKTLEMTREPVQKHELDSAVSVKKPNVALYYELDWWTAPRDARHIRSEWRSAYRLNLEHPSKIAAQTQVRQRSAPPLWLGQRHPIDRTPKSPLLATIGYTAIDARREFHPEIRPYFVLSGRVR